MILIDVLDVWTKHQRSLDDFCERAKLIYWIDEFIGSTTINLLRYGLESPAPTHIPEPTFHEPTFHPQGVDSWPAAAVSQESDRFLS